MASYKQLLNDLSDGNELKQISAEDSARLKQCLLAMYCDVKEVCDRYGLSLLLIGGSALGAVRHKGFIPWDDDMDLSMTREDFEIFKTVFEKELGDRYLLSAPNYHPCRGEYEVDCRGEQEGDRPREVWGGSRGVRTKNRFPQIMKKNTTYVSIEDVDADVPKQIYLDFFLLEHVPKGALPRLARGLWSTALMFAAGMAQSYQNRNAVLERYCCRTEAGRKAYRRRMRLGRLFSVFSADTWFDWVDASFHYKKETGYLGIVSGRKHYFGEIFERDVFFPPREAEFEGMKVNIPGEFDPYLRNLYGEYMELPPEDKREKHFIYQLDFEREI